MPRVRQTRRFIPEDGPFKAINVKVTVPQYDEMEDHCWEDRQTLSQFVREAIARENDRRRKLHPERAKKRGDRLMR